MPEKKYLEKIESLEIQLQHITNDYLLTKEEFDKASRNYLEILTELKEKNKELQDFQKNLEGEVVARTSELREFQNILQLKSEELQIMLDSSPAMIFFTEKQNKFVRVNKPFADFVGVSPKEIIGKYDTDFFPRNAEQFRRHNGEVLDTGSPIHDILEQINHASGERWIQMDKIPYRDLKGNIIGVICFALDITDKKMLEEQLIQSEKLATVGQLVAGVAHELNNPLAVISGFTQLLHGLPYIKEKDKNKLSKIMASAKRCAAIVDNLLKFSRKSKMDKTNIRIEEILKDSVSMMEHTMSLDNIDIELKISELPGTVGDGNHLQSVFLNMIKNAHDAILSAKDHGKITIKANCRNNKIQIYFCDNGPGVPEEHQHKLFDPFFSTKDVGKGTGLGLSICYGIIEEHEGRLTLDTKYKKGAKFEIVLPVKDEIFEQKETVTSLPPPDKAKILLIDDEAEIIEMEKDILEESFDYEIDTALNGRDGLSLIESNNYNYDVIVCDMKMPGELNGEIVYSRIKEKNPGLASRIIFVTGDITGDTKQFIEDHDLLFLRKPFNINEFIEIIGAGISRNPNNTG